MGVGSPDVIGKLRSLSQNYNLCCGTVEFSGGVRVLGLEESLVKRAREGDVIRLDQLLSQKKVSPDAVVTEKRGVCTDYGLETFTYEKTPLIEACLNGHIGVVKRLLNAAVDVNKESVGRNGGVILQQYSALSAALMKGHDEIVKLLLEKDANVKFIAQISRLTFELRNDDGQYNSGSDVRVYSTLHLAIRANMPDQNIRELFEKEG